MVRLRPLRHLLGLAILFFAVASEAAVPGSPRKEGCHVPDVLLNDKASLPFTTEAMSHHRPLVIVALGSSSTFGFGATTRTAAYPAVVQRELSAALGYPVRVINRGVNGETISHTAARIPKDVLADHPVLVIWQTGTNDLLHGN